MRQKMLIAVLIGVVALGYIAYINAMTNTSARPDSYRAAVERRLDQAQFSYRKVEVTDGCAPTYQFCRTYAGTVRVLTESTTLAGRIDCRRRWTDCTLTLPAAGLRGLALPDVVSQLPRTLDEVWERLQEWFHAVSGQSSVSVLPQLTTDH
jgi:hypothetical protein